jgi:hypothetical protein
MICSSANRDFFIPSLAKSNEASTFILVDGAAAVRRSAPFSPPMYPDNSDRLSFGRRPVD